MDPASAARGASSTRAVKSENARGRAIGIVGGFMNLAIRRPAAQPA